MYAFLNDKIIKKEEVAISPFDLGFTRGFGVFAYLRTYKDNEGVPQTFYLEKHIDGLLNSAKTINLEHKYSKEFLIQKVEEILNINNKEEAKGLEKHGACVSDKYIKIILTGGISNSMRQENKTNPTLLILIDNFIDFKNELYTDGVNLKVCDYQREFSESKTLNYIYGIKNLSDQNIDDKINLSEQRKFDLEKEGQKDFDLGKEGQKDPALRKEEISIFEPLYINPETKSILETSNSNFFFIKNNIIYTQKDNIFKGVVRDLILGDFGDILKNKKLIKDIIEIENIKIKDIQNYNTDKNYLDINICEGIFITGTGKEILPINSIIDDIGTFIYKDNFNVKNNIILQSIISEWRAWTRKDK